MSKIEDAVCEDIQKRAAQGLQKYGLTMDRSDLYMDNWFQHAYEEALDLAVYMKKIMLIRTEAKQLIEDYGAR